MTKDDDKLTIEGTVIESIRAHDADLAQKIMDKMFVFDDVIKLDDKAIQGLEQAVDIWIRKHV